MNSFHIVNGDSISTNFFKKDFHGKRKNLILTEALFKLQETGQYKNLKYETEARWRLVETAWNLGISTNLLKVEYNANDELLIVNSGVRRTDVTSVRSALNGYQKGKCFYCFNDIDLHEHQNLDVDHFIPFSLQMCFLDELNLNGVWNLVLACQSCNRGAGGKFNKVPHIKYLERLYKRNEFLINSHHPLRETLMSQTGLVLEDRRHFLMGVYDKTKRYLHHTWIAKDELKQIF